MVEAPHSEKPSQETFSLPSSRHTELEDRCERKPAKKPSQLIVGIFINLENISPKCRG